MKKLITLGIIVMVITACSVAAHAFAGVALNLSPTNENGAFQTIQVGWLTDDGTGNPTTNSLDAGYDAGNTQAPNPGQIILEVTNTFAGSKIQYDYRAPITAEGVFQIWRLKASVAGYDSGFDAATPIGMSAYFNPGFLPTGAKFYILKGDLTTQAACLGAIGTANQLAMLDPTNAAAGYNSGATTWTIPMSVFNEDLGVWLPGSTRFTVYAVGTAVPEPGSLLALFSGIVGLVGFGIRRRK